MKVELRHQNQIVTAATVMHDQMTSSQITQIDYLKELNFTIIPSIINDEVSLRGKIATDGVIFDTIISLPKQVPPSYPTFYLVDSGLELLEPHIERPYPYELSKNTKKNIVCRTCIREEQNKSYSSNPVDLLHYLYKDFVELCTKIARKEFDSKAEIFKEFDSYWPNTIEIYWDIQGIPMDASLYEQVTVQYKSEDNVKLYIVTDRPKNVIDFANKNGWNYKKEKSVYFDIENEMPIPLPYTYGDLVKLLKQTDKFEQFKKLEKRITSQLFFIGFNLESGEKHFVGVWMNAIPVNGKIKKHSKVTGIMHSPLHKANHFLGGHVESIDYNRLMLRGGNKVNAELSSKQKKIAIVGCGSVGSTIAFKLSKSGIRNFVLIDPEKLKAANIGRHQLGMSYVGDNKALALSKHLESQFIGLNAIPSGNKVEFSDTINLLQNVDLIITAIGSDAPAVEPWLADKVSKGLLPQILTCWLEADGISGHALSIKKGDKLNFDQTCDTLNILNREYAASLLETEVGCNSTYMPYGFLDADIHINHIASFALSLLKDTNKKALSSFGNIDPYIKWLVKDVQAWTVMEYEYEALSL
ncbi:MAG: hypothetical protein ACI9RG_000527 [Sulfurimonas sp.]|jgi:hypothetical protein